MIPKLILFGILNWRSILKAVGVAMVGFALIVTIPQMLILALLQKSMFPWPVDAPTRVNASDPAYAATGWRIAQAFGWAPRRDDPGSYELREGIELVGDPFCMGCAVPPPLDIMVTQGGVRWDQEGADDPMTEGAGVVVEFELQHPEESGMLNGERIYGLYGHLHPYRVHIRTQSCQQNVTCPDYRNTDAGAVSVTCQGRMVELSRGVGEVSYAYATPGRCQARVRWPARWTPDGPTVVTFDQQISPGRQSSDAAISFRAQEPPPPPTPTPPARAPGPRP